jgi:hypothetical protein
MAAFSTLPLAKGFDNHVDLHAASKVAAMHLIVGARGELGLSDFDS